MDLSRDDRPGPGRGDLLTLGAALAAAGFLTTLSPDSRAAVTSQLRATVLAPVLSAHAAVRRHARLSERLEEIRTERDSLARALAEARRRAARMRDLRKAAGDTGRIAGEALTVRLDAAHRRIGRARSFTLAAGRAAGIEPPAGIFTSRGLLGVVRWAGETGARGEYWTHPDFRVSVRTRSGDASGIVRPFYEDAQAVMLLEGAPYQDEIPEGTVLYTSGLGGVYPPGIPVGTVRSVASVESGWERSYRVEAAARPEQTEVAMVWLEASSPSP